MTLSSFDRYTLHARLFPILIVLLPIGFSIACFFPERFVGWDFLVGLVTSGGLSIFFEQLARDPGKAKQPKLYDMWGGKPTTIILRHKDSALDPPTLERYHQKLSSIVSATPLPSPDEENKNPEKADQTYNSCVEFLIQQTQDKERFPMIFAENVNYGFRRNLWGMKPSGITITIISIVMVLFQLWSDVDDLEKIKPVILFTLLMSIALLVIWIMRIRPNWVRTAADEYTRQLLAACDIL